MNAVETWRAFHGLFTKEVRRFTRIWVQTVVPPIITMTLYFIIFGGLIGSQISDISGFTYMQFIVPGLVMMSVITNSYMNVCSSFFSSKFQRSIEELLVSPTPNWVIVMGFVLGGVLRGLIIGTIVLIVSFLFTGIHVNHIGWTFAFAFVTAFFFSQAGLANAIFAKKFDDISIIPTFVLTPLTYLGGVFYSLDQLSPFWRKISQFNPMVYMINGMRRGVLGVSDVDVSVAFGLIVIMLIMAFSFNLYLLHRGIGLRE